MPTTHIGEWARANSIDLDPLYATGNREGGSHCRGTGIPGVEPSNHDVFSGGEWKKRFALHSHESWHQDAKEQIAPAVQSVPPLWRLAA